MKKTYTFLAVNVFLVSLIVVGFLFHIIQNFYTHDDSRLTYLISLLMVFNLLINLYDTYMYESKTYYGFSKTWIEKWIYFIKDKFLFIGLAGTLVGFFGLMQGLLVISAAGSTGQAEISGMISHIVISCQTIFAPTLMGIIAKLWTDLNLYITRYE